MCEFGSFQMIVLNVGGTEFKCTRTTLLLYDSFFSGLVKGCLDGSKDLTFFIDRDPTHFRYILNYMRGCNYIPRDIETLEQVIEEADFYSLLEYKDKLRQMLFVKKKDTIEFHLASISKAMLRN